MIKKQIKVMLLIIPVFTVIILVAEFISGPTKFWVFGISFCISVVIFFRSNYKVWV